MRPSTRRLTSLTAAAVLTLTIAPAASGSDPGEFRSSTNGPGEFRRSGPVPPQQTASPEPAPTRSSPSVGSSTPSSPSVGAARAKSTPALNLTVEPLWSGTGEKLVAIGEVFNAKTYRPLSGRPISVQARTLGSSTWRTVSRPETNANGAFRVDLKADRSKTYRAVYSGNAWYSAKQSNWERQTAAPGTKVRTSVRLYPTKAGGAKVQGRVTQLWTSRTRPLRGANVYIQARQAYGSYWFDAGRTKTNAHGYYNWNSKVRPNACYRYRAIYKGNSTWAAKSAQTQWSNC